MRAGWLHNDDPEGYEKIATRLEATATIKPGDEKVAFFNDDQARKPEEVFDKFGSLLAFHHFYWFGVSVAPGIGATDEEIRFLKHCEFEFRFASTSYMRLNGGLVQGDLVTLSDPETTPVQSVATSGRPVEIIALEAWRALLHAPRQAEAVKGQVAVPAPFMPPALRGPLEVTVILHGLLYRMTPDAMKGAVEQLPPNALEHGLKGGWIKKEWLE
jgi:hypothetical protein